MKFFLRQVSNAENTVMAGEGQLYLRLQLCVGWWLLRGLHDGRLCADAGGSGLGGLSHLRGGQRHLQPAASSAAV